MEKIDPYHKHFYICLGLVKSTINIKISNTVSLLSIRYGSMSYWRSGLSKMINTFEEIMMTQSIMTQHGHWPLATPHAIVSSSPLPPPAPPVARPSRSRVLPSLVLPPAPVSSHHPAPASERDQPRAAPRAPAGRILQQAPPTSANPRPAPGTARVQRHSIFATVRLLSNLPYFLASH